MKPKPDPLWKRLLEDALPLTMPEASGEEISRIVTRLRWRPGHAHAISWEDALWPLLLRFALPAAALILILAAALPAPDPTAPSDSVDDLIAAILPQP